MATFAYVRVPELVGGGRGQKAGGRRLIDRRNTLESLLFSLPCTSAPLPLCPSLPHSQLPTPHSLPSVIGGSLKYKYLIMFNFLISFRKLRIFLYGQLYLQSLEIVIEQ
jgi:hypothetical protein